jgi:hypothetical protein
MAVMRILDPAVAQPLPAEGWQLIALDAGRYAHGLQATIQVYNSKAEHTKLLCLAEPDNWTDYEQAAASKA